MDRDSVHGIATRYGLDGSGIEFDGGKIFCPRPKRPWGSPSLPRNGKRVIPRGNFVGEWRWPQPLSGAEVKERLKLYLYLTFGTPCLVLWCSVPLSFYRWITTICKLLL